MAVRAKFYVSSIERFTYGDAIVVKLQAVTRKDGDNAAWSSATPSGSLTMTISNKSAWPLFLDAFEKGADLYVDFTLADTEGQQKPARVPTP